MTVSAIPSKRSGWAETARLLRRDLAANRRAAFGLVVIAALLAGYGLTLLGGATAAAETEYRGQTLMLQRIATVAGQRDWPQRRAASAALRAALQRRLWTADSDGLAQADLQAWISGLGRRIGLPMLDIRTEAARIPNLPEDWRQITATISAQPSEPAVISLLEQLDRAPHLTVVSRLHVQQKPEPILELVLVGYARIVGAGRGGGK